MWSRAFFFFKPLAFFVFLLIARPVYSIPAFVENLCSKLHIGACSKKDPPAAPAQAPAPVVEPQLTESERQVLVRLLEKQKQLQLKEQELERREAQLKTLHEDLQNQVIQLERLQEQVTQGIKTKETEDTQQLDKVVLFYGKMDPSKASASLAKLPPATAVKILMQLKEKQTSSILSQMEPTIAAKLVEEMTNKKP